MGMEVVAEGAPGLATIQLLKAMRCDKGQCYAVSVPPSADGLSHSPPTFRLVGGAAKEGCATEGGETLTDPGSDNSNSALFATANPHSPITIFYLSM